MHTDPDIHLTDDQFHALGEFAAHWAHLETEVNFTISALGHIVLGDQRMPYPFNRRMTHWRRVANSHYSGKHLEVISTIIDSVSAIHDNRSILLHGRMYGLPDEPSSTIIVESNRHLNEWHSHIREIDTADLREGTRIIRTTHLMLVEFNAQNLRVSPPTLPRRYP